MLYLHLKQGATLEHISSGKFISKPGSVHPRRTLDEHVLLIGSDGEYPIRVEDREYVLTKDSYMLLPAGREHMGTGACSDGQSHYWCHFRAEQSTVSEEAAARRDEFVIPEYGRIGGDRRLIILFRQLIDCARDPSIPDFARRSECSAYLTLLMTETALEKIRSDGSADRRESRQAFTEYVKEWIRINCASINASDVAEAFVYNHDYLTRIFKAETGCTIAGYINKCRIENVQKLLLETNLTVREIALTCGYNDEKQMMKLFKQIHDVTPSEYRRTFSKIYMNNE